MRKTSHKINNSNNYRNRKDKYNFNNNENDLSSFTNSANLDENSSLYRANKRAFNQKIKNEKNRLKQISKKNRRFFKVFWLVMIAVIAVMLSQFLLVGVRDMLGMNRTVENTASISIPKDTSHKDVANILKNAGVIKNSDWFNAYVSTVKHSLKFGKGDYEIKTNLEYEEIINYLNMQSNRLDTINVTFAEGLTIMECAQILSDKGICDKNAFLNRCNSSDFDKKYEFLSKITDSDKCYYKLEGYLYPDTYKFYQDTDPDAVINKMLSNFENKVISKNTVSGYNEKISIEQIANESNMTLNELIILASMVQSEAADIQDMKVIASIFMNRLSADVNAGFLYLNSDPTIYYPYKTEQEIPSGFVSRYNTYNTQGLPIGAVRNPGIDAINAVLNPEKTNYLYFCHDENGNAYYARTEAAHNNNLIKAGIK